jgi:hypothetical protein
MFLVEGVCSHARIPNVNVLNTTVFGEYMTHAFDDAWMHRVSVHHSMGISDDRAPHCRMIALRT